MEELKAILSTYEEHEQTVGSKESLYSISPEVSYSATQTETADGYQWELKMQ